CRPARQDQQRTTWRRRLPSRALFSVGSPPAQRSANAARPSLALRPCGCAVRHPADGKLALRGNAVFSRLPRALAAFLSRSFSCVHDFPHVLSWPISSLGPTILTASNKPCNAATPL